MSQIEESLVHQMTKSDVKNVGKINEGLVSVVGQVKNMKVEQLQNELIQVKVENGENEARLQLEIEQTNKFKKKVEEQRLVEENLLKKIEELTDTVKKTDQDNRENSRSLEEAKKNTSKQKKKLRKLLDELEYFNDKSHANAKLIVSIYKDDATLVKNVKEQIFKRLDDLTDNENTFHRELNKTSMFLEEFVKIIVYLKNTVEAKEAEIEELHRTIRASQLVSNMQASRLVEIKGDDDLVSKDSQDGGNFRRLEDQLKLITDRLEGNQNTESVNKIEKLKIKLNTLKDDNTNLEDMIKKLKKQNDNLKKESDDKTVLLLKNLKEIKKLNETYTDDDSDLFNPSDFDKLDFNKRLKEEMEALAEYIEEAKVKGNRKGGTVKSKSINEGDKKANNVYKLQDDIQRLERKNLEMEEALNDAYKKIKELRKLNIESYKDKQTNDVQDNFKMKLLEKYNTRRLDEFKEELDAKDKIVLNLIHTNDLLTEKIKAYQSEKMRVLKDKLNNEELYRYFDQKATEIYVLNEKVAKLVSENKRMKRFIDQQFYTIKQENKTFDNTLGEADESYKLIIEELSQALFIASSDQDFDPNDFKKILGNKGNKPLGIQNSKVKRKETMKQSKGGDNQGIEESGIDQEGSGQQNYTSDVDLLTRMNTVLIQNYDLKARLEIKDKKLVELSRDLMQYKKKIKTVMMLEPKIERMISQNVKLKTMLVETQSLTIDRSIDDNGKLADLQNFVDVSEELMEGVIENIKRLENQKKNLEKKVHVLQGQKHNLDMDVERLSDRLQHETKDLRRDLRVKEDQIIVLEKQADKVEPLQKELNAAENRVICLENERDSLKGTIELLEKNLEVVANNNQGDRVQLKDDIETHRKRLDNQVAEYNELLSQKLSLDSEVQRLKEQLIYKNQEGVNKDKAYSELKDKFEQKEEDMVAIKDEYGDLKRNVEQAEYLAKTLEVEKKTLIDDNRILKERIDGFLDKNNDYLSGERAKISEEMGKQYMDKVKNLESQLYEQQKEIGEKVYLIEKKDKEVSDLRNKLQMKNKQLIQFNSFFTSMTNSKNPKEVEISRILLQNRALLKEIELLRSQKSHLKEMYDNLLNNLDRKQTASASKFETAQAEANETKLRTLKSNFDKLYIDNYNLKTQFDVLINCYEDKLVIKTKDLERLQTKLIKIESDSKFYEESYKSLKLDYEDTKQENELLKEKNDSLNKDKTTDREIIEELKNRTRILNEQLESKMERLKIVENNNEFNKDIVAENSTLRAEIIKLNEIIDTQKNDNRKRIEEFEYENRDLKNKLISLEDNKDFKEKMDDYQVFNRKCKEFVDAKPSLGIAHREPLKTLNLIFNEFDDLEVKLKKAGEREKELSDEIRGKEVELTTLKNQLRAEKHKLDKKEGEQERLKVNLAQSMTFDNEMKDKINRLEGQIRDKDKTIRELEEEKREYTMESLRQSRMDLNNDQSEQINILTLRYNEKKREFDEYKKSKFDEIAKYKKDWRELKNENDKLQEDKRNYEYEKDNLLEKISDLEKAKIVFADAIKKKNEEIEELELENDTLADKLENMNKTLNKDKEGGIDTLYNNSKAEVERLKERLRDFQNEFSQKEEDYKDDIRQLEVKVKEQEGIIKNLNEELRNAMTIQNDLQLKIDSLEKEKDTLIREKKSAHEVKLSAVGLENQIKTKNVMIEQLNEEIEDMQGVINGKQDEIKALKKEINQKDLENKAILDMKAHLETYLDDYKETQTNLQILEKEYKRLEREKTDLDRQVERLKRDLESEQKALKREKNRTKIAEDNTNEYMEKNEKLMKDIIQLKRERK